MKKIVFITSIVTLMLGACNSDTKPEENEKKADTLTADRTAAKADKDPNQAMVDHYYQDLTVDQYRATKRMWLTVSEAQELVNAAEKGGATEISIHLAAYDKAAAEILAKNLGVKPDIVLDKTTILFMVQPGTGGSGTAPVPPRQGRFCPPPQSCDSSINLSAATKLSPAYAAVQAMINHYYKDLKLDNYRATKRMWMQVAELKKYIAAANKVKAQEISFYYGAYDKANAEAYIKANKGTSLSDILDKITVVVVVPGLELSNPSVAGRVRFCPPPQSCDSSVVPPVPQPNPGPIGGGGSGGGTQPSPSPGG